MSRPSPTHGRIHPKAFGAQPLALKPHASAHFVLKYLLFALLFTGAPSSAQTVPGTITSQPKQFCRLFINMRGLTGQALDIKMMYGQESKKAPVTDSRLAAEAAQVAAFDTEAQALNYLSSQGWELVGYQIQTGPYVSALLQRAVR
jgi:hypothetical protein